MSGTAPNPAPIPNPNPGWKKLIGRITATGTIVAVFYPPTSSSVSATPETTRG